MRVLQRIEEGGTREGEMRGGRLWEQWRRALVSLPRARQKINISSLFVVSNLLIRLSFYIFLFDSTTIWNHFKILRSSVVTDASRFPLHFDSQTVTIYFRSPNQVPTSPEALQ